jgi:hypothetical protein
VFAIDRWRNWKPEILGESFENAPTKPTKASFVSFVGSIPGDPPNILDPLHDLRPSFVAWFDARIWLDAEAVALRIPNPRWCSGIGALYADHCAWMFDRGLVPPVLAEFRHLLEELCLEMRDLHGEQLVSHIALKEDVEAQKAWTEG